MLFVDTENRSVIDVKCIGSVERQHGRLSHEDEVTLAARLHSNFVGVSVASEVQEVDRETMLHRLFLRHNSKLHTLLYVKLRV